MLVSDQHGIACSRVVLKLPFRFYRWIWMRTLIRIHWHWHFWSFTHCTVPHLSSAKTIKIVIFDRLCRWRWWSEINTVIYGWSWTIARIGFLSKRPLMLRRVESLLAWRVKIFLCIRFISHLSILICHLRLRRCWAKSILNLFLLLLHSIFLLLPLLH